jgi:hypothetical protein
VHDEATSLLESSLADSLIGLDKLYLGLLLKEESASAFGEVLAFLTDFSFFICALSTPSTSSVISFLCSAA